MTEIMIKPYQLPEIEWNYDAVKEELEARLEYFDGVVYTDDTIADAKKDRAQLNKIDKALNDKRKEVKAAYDEPIKDFEKKIKELSGMIQSVNGKIDAQVKTYEDKKKEEKKSEVEALIKEVWACELQPTWNDKWLNATYKMAQIKEELEQEQTAINYDIDTIMNVAGSDERAVILGHKYRETRDIRAVMRLNQELTEAEKTKEKPRVEPNIEQPTPAIPEEKTYEVVFKVTGTMTQLKSLRSFLDANNIKFEKGE